MSKEWYPLILKPNYVALESGGDLLYRHYHRQLPSSELPIGESYEVVDRGNLASEIENGEFAGCTLRELLREFADSIVGLKHTPEHPFPLTVKFIDSGMDQPLRVHPEPELCMNIPGIHTSTKMWYVVNAWQHARIHIGIARHCTKREFLSKIEANDSKKVVQSFPSEPGDAYYIPPGRIHAIGAGNLILSIEHAGMGSFDEDGLDNDDLTVITSGNSAAENLSWIHFEDRALPRIRGESTVVLRNRKIPLMVNCPYYYVDELRLVETFHDRTDPLEFHLLVAVEGDIIIKVDQHSLALPPSRVCCLPAALGHYSIIPTSRMATILKIHMRII